MGLIRLFLFITKAKDEWIYIKLESAVPGTIVQTDIKRARPLTSILTSWET